MKSLSPPVPDCFVPLSILTSGLGTLIFPSLTEDSLTSYFVEKVEDSTYIFLTSYYSPPSVTSISGSMFQILPLTARTTLPPGIPNLSPSQEHTPSPKGVFVFWNSAPVQTHSQWLPTNIYMRLPYSKHKQKQGNPLPKQYKPHLPPHPALSSVSDPACLDFAKRSVYTVLYLYCLLIVQSHWISLFNLIVQTAFSENTLLLAPIWKEVPGIFSPPGSSSSPQVHSLNH